MDSQKKKKVFILVFLLFVTAAILVVVDMGSKTTAPWNKKEGQKSLNKYKVDHFKKKIE